MLRTSRKSSTGRSEAGRKGGRATSEKYGSDHYSAIGQKGGQASRSQRGTSERSSSDATMNDRWTTSGMADDTSDF